MKIVFWSCLNGHTRITSSACAIATAAAVFQKKDCSLIQTHYNNDPLINQFFANIDSEVVSYLNGSGVDSLIRNVKSELLGAEETRRCAFSFVNGRLNLFAGSSVKNKDVFDGELLPVVTGCMQALDGAFEVSFVDAAPGASPLAAEAVKAADLVVVGLSQSNNINDYLFEHYAFPKGKAFYVFGDYDANQSCNIKNLERRYHKKVSPKSVGCVPHSSEFADALNTGRIISFFLRNEDCKPGDSNYEFFSEVRKTTEKILQCAQISMNGGRL